MPTIMPQSFATVQGRGISTIPKISVPKKVRKNIVVIERFHRSICYNKFTYLSFDLDYLELVFTALFFIEMILRMYGLGLRGYFHSAFNKYDFVVSNNSFCCYIKFKELWPSGVRISRKNWRFPVQIPHIRGNAV